MNGSELPEIGKGLEELRRGLEGPNEKPKRARRDWLHRAVTVIIAPMLMNQLRDHEKRLAVVEYLVLPPVRHSLLEKRPRPIYGAFGFPVELVLEKGKDDGKRDKRDRHE